MKNSKLLGIMAAISIAVLFVALFRRRLRWGFLFLNFLVAFAAKWQESRDLNRIQTLIDRAD